MNTLLWEQLSCLRQGGKLRMPQFQIGGHRGGNGPGFTDAESALGEEIPAHAAPNFWWSVRIGLTFGALWLLPVVALVAVLGPDNVFSRIGIFFSQMAVVTFGGAYAVLAYVAQQAVDTCDWLHPHEMLDGLGMAETTPGPLIMVVQFVGFLGAYRDARGLNPLMAATLGAVLTTWVTFMPCFLWIFLGAPFIEKLRGNVALTGALSAITAAVVGVILNLAIWFALHVLFRTVVEIEILGFQFDVPVWSTLNWASAALTLGAIVAVFRFAVSLGWLIARSATAGIVFTLSV